MPREKPGRMIDLTERVAVVTGSTRGIGRGIAEKLAAHGATLIVHGREPGLTLEQARDELASEYSVPVAMVAGDVGVPATSANLVREAFAKFKRLDIYVNNAGVLIDGLIGMIPESAVDETLAINLKSVIYGTQAAARL